MKIGIVSDVAPPYIGGAESITSNLAKRMVKRGNEVVWLTARLPNTEKEEFIDGVKIKRIWIPFKNQYLKTRTTFAFLSLLHLLDNDFDVIQFNSFVGAVAGSFYSSDNKLAYVYEFFMDHWKHLGKSWVEKNIYPWIEKLIATSFDNYVALSKYTKSCLVKYGADKNNVKVVYPGIEHEYFFPSEPIFKKRKYTIGWCGRMGLLSWSKNLDYLLKAFKIIKRELGDVELIFAGSGWDTFRNDVLSYGLKIGSDVRYVGRLARENMRYFYSSLDCYVLSSFSEGFGMVLLESQACGTPFVAFKVAAIPEAGKDGETCFLVKSIDPESLARKTIEVLVNKEKERLSKKCVKFAKRFDWDKSTDKLLRVYKKVVS